MKLGLIQVDLHIGGTVEEKQGRLISLAESCLKDGADLVFFPEAYQYEHCREIRNDIPALKKINKEWQGRCSSLAKKYHAYVVPWDYYADEDGCVYNSSYILDREGNFVGRYCKCNLTFGEQRILTKGNDYPVFDLDFGRIGIMICFDNYFPESAAALGAKGAQLILYPLYGDTLNPGWELKLRTRAIDHSLYIASCQIDRYFDIAYTGVVNPEGNVIEKLTEVSSYKVVEIDLDKEVITNTMAVPGQKENLKDYLHRCRNYNAYRSLTEQGAPVKSWEEIFKGNPPV